LKGGLGREGSQSQRTRVNKAIRAPQVRLIAEDGEQLGIMSSRDALATAEERGLDLVEVAEAGA